MSGKSTESDKKPKRTYQLRSREINQREETPSPIVTPAESDSDISLTDSPFTSTKLGAPSAFKRSRVTPRSPILSVNSSISQAEFIDDNLRDLQFTVPPSLSWNRYSLSEIFPSKTVHVQIDEGNSNLDSSDVFNSTVINNPPIIAETSGVGTKVTQPVDHKPKLIEIETVEQLELNLSKNLTMAQNEQDDGEAQARCSGLGRNQNATINDLFNVDLSRTVAKPEFYKPLTFDPSGGTSAVTFFEAYEQAASSNNWDSTLKLMHFRAYLRGHALQWYRDFAESNPLARWGDLREAFEKSFFPANYRSQILTELFNRRQDYGEPLIKHFYSVLTLCDKVDKHMPVPDKIEHIMRGMLQKYRDRITLQRPRDLRELKELLELCSQTEDSSHVRFWDNGSRGGTPSRDKKDHDLSKLEAKLLKVIDDKVKSRESGFAKRPLGRANNYTGQRGRAPLDREGPQRPDLREYRTFDNKLKCYTCGRTGHMSRSCPNYQRAERPVSPARNIGTKDNGQTPSGGSGNGEGRR